MRSKTQAVEGWKTEALGRVARLTMGQSPDSRYYSEEEKGLHFLQGCAEFKGRFPKHSLYAGSHHQCRQGADLWAAPSNVLQLPHLICSISSDACAKSARQIFCSL